MKTSPRAVSASFTFLSPKAPGTCLAHIRTSINIYLQADDKGKQRKEREGPGASGGVWVSLWAEQLMSLPHVDAHSGGLGGSTRWQTNSVAFWLSFTCFFGF